MPEPSLELIQSLLQRLLDGHDMLRDDVRNVRRRMSRLEASMVALQFVPRISEAPYADLRHYVTAEGADAFPPYG